jgi:hypothetical protein
MRGNMKNDNSKRAFVPPADEPQADQDVLVEIDEEALERRRAETEAYMATPQVQAWMEEGRLAPLAEEAAKAARQAAAEDEDDADNRVVFGAVDNGPEVGGTS